MLTEIEKKIVTRAANSIIDDCLGDRPENPAVCIEDTRYGIKYLIDAFQDLPKDHPIKPQLNKICEHINNLPEIASEIKEDTIKFSVLRGVI